MRKFITLFVVIFVTVFGLYAQTPQQLISKLCSKFSMVKDFKSDVGIEFMIPSIKLEKMSGKVYYKQPDQYKVKLTGVAFLPKQNPYALFNLLKDSSKYIAVLNGIEKINGTECYFLNIIPLNDPDWVLAKLWVSKKDNSLLQTDITTRSNGSVMASYQYAPEMRYALPSAIEFRVDMHTFKLPKMISVDLNSKAKKTDAGKNATGLIRFSFKEYQINKGVKDEELK